MEIAREQLSKLFDLAYGEEEHNLDNVSETDITKALIQIEKRLRPLNEQEKDELISYIEKPFYHQDQDIEYVIRASSCLLLEDTERAKKYYNMMNKESQEYFSENYPVYRFWKE